MFLMFVLCISCEKAGIEEEVVAENTKEQTSGKDDKNNSSGDNNGKDDTDNNTSDHHDNNNPNGNDNQNGNDNSNGDASDWSESDEEMDNYLEKDFIDGDHQDNEDNNSGQDNNNQDVEEDINQNSDNPDQERSVAAFINTSHGKSLWVKGYIVGACAQNIKNAQFKNFTYANAILLADSPSETDISKIISIQLKSGKLREIFNLKDHPENFNKKAAFYGSRNTYLGIPGMKDDIRGHHWVN